jgi:hypothetical protein
MASSAVTMPISSAGMRARKKKAFKQVYGSDDLDASLLMMPLGGFGYEIVFCLVMKKDSIYKSDQQRSRPHSKRPLTNNHPELPPTGPDDWDSLIDDPFNIGPFSRSTKAGDWWVITGMHVKLPDALVGQPAGTSKLLVLADTISAGISGAKEIRFDGLSDVLLIGDTLNRYNDCNFYRNFLNLNETFRIAVAGRTPPGHANNFVIRMEGSGRNLRKGASIFRSDFTWSARAIQRPEQIEWYSTHTPGMADFYRYRFLPLPNSGPGFDACRPFLARLLLTAQFLFEKNRPSDANDVLARLVRLLALNPGVASWQEIGPQIAATREIFQPQLPGSDRVPNLSAAVYDGLAKSYGPALQKFAEAFQQFVNRTGDINQRTGAVKLMLNKEDNAIRFQALVTQQLEGNLKAATENLSKADASMKLQNDRVKGQKAAFEKGVARWRTQKEREAAMAISGSVFSFVTSVAQVFTGNAGGAANAAAAVANANMYARALAEMMEKLRKIIVVVAQIVKMSLEIAAAASRLSNNQNFATDARGVGERMANLRREADSGLGDAPSASAYWDQLWVEVDTALRPVVDEGIAGAAEYLKELRVMVIYGRALTSAEAAIPPIAQELAQAELLTKLAENQRKAIEQEIGRLQAGQTASATVAVALWLGHRSVQRAMFAALQDYDAAHRYWALTVERPQRNPSRSTGDLADDLLDIGELQVSVQRALASFRPGPQPLKPSFDVPETAVADFLRDGSFALRFTPDFGPVATWGDIGRVRVQEVRAWVIWNEVERPKLMEFTIRTDGDYYDQRVEASKMKKFRFIGPRVDWTFKYDPAKAENNPEASISAWATVAEDYRLQYSQPTLFTEWQFSLPKVKGMINPETLKALQGAVKGIKLEFSGTYLKDARRF